MNLAGEDANTKLVDIVALSDVGVEKKVDDKLATADILAKSFHSLTNVCNSVKNQS